MGAGLDADIHLGFASSSGRTYALGLGTALTICVRPSLSLSLVIGYHKRSDRGLGSVGVTQWGTRGERSALTLALIPLFTHGSGTVRWSGMGLRFH